VGGARSQRTKIDRRVLAMLRINIECDNVRTSGVVEVLKIISRNRAKVLPVIEATRHTRTQPHHNSKIDPPTLFVT